MSSPYNIIYADPPWPFATWSHRGLGRSGEAHYSTMSHDDIEQLPIASMAADDAVLFLWVVQTQLPQALRVVSAWGFTLKSVAFAWVKGAGLPLFPDDIATQMGMGMWTRAGFEQCWLATRGRPKRVAMDVRQVFIDKRREHSRKPDEIADAIVRLCGDLPRIELFARTRRPGWDAWGNETDKFSSSGLSASAAPPIGTSGGGS